MLDVITASKNFISRITYVTRHVLNYSNCRLVVNKAKGERRKAARRTTARITFGPKICTAKELPAHYGCLAMKFYQRRITPEIKIVSPYLTYVCYTFRIPLPNLLRKRRSISACCTLFFSFFFQYPSTDELKVTCYSRRFEFYYYVDSTVTMMSVLLVAKTSELSGYTFV